MEEKTVTLLRVPLLHNCDFYDEQKAESNVYYYFTISESTFKKALNELSTDLNENERKFIIDDLTRWDYDELKNEAELDSMHSVFLKIDDSDILKKEIIFPREFDTLYEQYLQTKPLIIDEKGRKWKVQKGNELLKKEELMWIVYRCDYSLE